MSGSSGNTTFSLFGGTTSKDVVSGMINSSIAVINNQNLTCVSDAINTEQIVINNCNNANIHDITFKEKTVMDTQCVMDTTVNSDVCQNIKDSIGQTADTTKDTWFPQLDKTESDIYTCMTQNLALEIENKIQTTCSQSIIDTETISCQDSANVGVNHVNFDIFASATQSCMLKSVLVTSASQELIDFITQHSTTLNTDPIADLAHDPLAILGILLVLGLFVLAPIMEGEYVIVKMVATPWFWIAAVVLTIFFVWVFVIKIPADKNAAAAKKEAAAHDKDAEEQQEADDERADAQQAEIDALAGAIATGANTDPDPSTYSADA